MASILLLPLVGLAQEKTTPSLPVGVDITVEPQFSTQMTQSALRTAHDVGELAAEVSVSETQDATFGFASKSPEAKFFLTGALYSEAFSYLNSGKLDTAADRLKTLEQEFVALGVPSSMFNYISKTRSLVEREKYSREALSDFLSLFQPFFEDYAASVSADKLVLFRAGSWLSDYGMVAAAGETGMLHQTGILDYFVREMERMDAPQGVMTALDEMAGIAAQEEISDRDARKLHDLIGKIQSILG